jgi:hypothetical protein
MPVAIKYTVPNLPTNIEDLNNKVIQPLVLISLRMNFLKLWLNDAKNLFNKKEAHKKNLTGYSQESSRSIETLSTLLPIVKTVSNYVIIYPLGFCTSLYVSYKLICSFFF